MIFHSIDKPVSGALSCFLLMDSKLTHTTSHSFDYSQKEINLVVVLNTHNTNLVVFIFNKNWCG